MFKLKHGALFFFSLVVGINMAFNDAGNWLLWTALLTLIVSLVGVIFKSENYLAYQQNIGTTKFSMTYLLLSWIQNTVIAIVSFYVIKLLTNLWG